MAGDGGSRAERSDATRRRLLEAGLALLQEDPSARLFEVLSARRVVTKATSSAGAYYHHFDDQDSYLAQLFTFALAKNPVPELTMSKQAFESAIASGLPFDQAIIAGGAAALRYADTDATWPLQLLVRAKIRRDPAAAQHLAEMYTLATEQTATYYGEILALSNHELRPPHTVRQLATAILALFEGLCLRRMVEPAAVADEDMGANMLALLHLYTRPIGETGDRVGWLSQVSAAWGSLPEAG